MDKAIAALKQGVSLSLQGNEVHVEISPCSFMYPNYGLQLSLSLRVAGKEVSKEFVLNKTVTPATATEADVQALLDTVRFQKCPCCGTATFVSTNPHDNRNAKCDPCFMTELRASFADSQAKADAKFKKHCEKMKQQGFKHMVDIVVHSASGSDKVVTHFISDIPTDIKKFAKQQHPRAVQLDIGRIQTL